MQVKEATIPIRARSQAHLQCSLLQEASLTTPAPLLLQCPHFSPGPQPDGVGSCLLSVGASHLPT